MKIKFRRRRGSVETRVWLAKVLAKERVLRREIAERLRRRAARLSPARLRWYVALFLSVGLMLYTWIGVRAVSRPRRAARFDVGVVTPAEGLLRRRVPHAGASGSGAAAANDLGSRARGATARSQLDSIEADPVLKRALDSLRAARPGFADTIRRLKEMAY